MCWLIAKPVALVLAIATVSAAAQWLKYPTPGIPRMPDGKPNLSAPAPRTRDGKPDLSGIWQLEPAPCTPESVNNCDDYPGAQEFRNIGARLKGGLPYQAWAAEVVKKRTADLGKDDPVSLCQPAGALRLLTYPPYRKIIQTPGVTMTEKFRRVNFGNLEIEITVDDPKAYTKPWTVKLHQLIVPDTELLDYYCQENEKDASHLVGK
jgi:hypothetical protein